MRVCSLSCGVIDLSRTRTDLSRLKAMCLEYGKVSPKEWPEGLLGVGPDMRAWVRSQEDAPKNAPKTTPKKVEKKKESVVNEVKGTGSKSIKE